MAFVDTETMKTYEAKGRVVVLAASTLESARLMLLSKSPAHPNGIGNSSGHVGHNFCEHLMGPSVYGLVKELVGKPRTLDDGRPGGFYVPRFRNLSEKHPDFIRGYGFEGGSGAGMWPGNAESTPGFGSAFKKDVRDHAGAFISMGGFGEVLLALRERDRHRSRRQGSLGHSGPPIQLQVRRQRAEDGGSTCRWRPARCSRRPGIEIVKSDADLLTEGWSIHELGTARMGTDPKTSVVNQFQQSHDVKNLFVVDGSTHVSASCQNPTWTIMALAWRSCDYLADQLGKGEL